ncbi:uncharacterized protein LOC131429006 [Malaya genurostris]|uniref:uncharacterized protein LOC131429006 n=1 Tax=Malaya genurostris TaxID=325434 RepID=UPI0026F37FE9|nr:uncharacterized protein LOC131429006 [Malaya genurostris]
MTNKYPHADHLTNEEVDYELVIRGRTGQVKDEPEAKYRLLRNLFYEDARENRDYPSPYTIDQEFDYILGKLEILRGMLDKGPDDRVTSRLKHFLLRVARCKTPDSSSERMQRELLHEIRALLNRTNGRKITEGKQSRELAADTRRSDLLSQHEELEVEEDILGAEGRDDQQDLTKGTYDRFGSNQGAIKKQLERTPEQVSRVESSQQQQALLSRIAELEKELSETRLSASVSRSFISRNARSTFMEEAIYSHPGMDRTNLDPPQQFRSGWSSGYVRSTPKDRPAENKKWDPPATNNFCKYAGTSHRERRDSLVSGGSRTYFEDSRRQGVVSYNLGESYRYASDESTDDERDWRTRDHQPRRGREDHRPRRGREREWYTEADQPRRRRESGDARQRPLEDFLHKIRRLAKMDRVADDVLLQRVHTILRGAAYDWYLCYSDEFLDWNDFEEKIRYMFGNPNKDQGNRQKIYERKQLRYETFLTFKMEIERLNKLLTRPLDSDRIFEVIWDNMRPHYRSKLACRTVRDLKKLEYYAYRIDAHDPAYRQTREGLSRPAHINRIEVEGEEEDSYSSYSETEEINAIGRRYDRERKRPSQPPQQHSVNPEAGRIVPLCWNCRATGHLWRQSKEEKRIFCYVCGTLGKTTTTCENHPRSPPTDTKRVCEVRVQTESCPHISVKVFDTDYDALLDSGASVSVTNIKDIAKRNGLELEPSPLKIVTADKTVHESLGYVQLPIRFRGVTKIIPTLVVPQVSRALILGYDFWKRFGIQPMILGENGFEQISTIQEIDSAKPSHETVQIPMLPITTLPVLQQGEPDETLDIPALELPEASRTTPETIETEHELTQGERIQLVEAIKLFPCTTENRLGRTSLLQHEIVLRDEAKPIRTPLYRCSPAVQAEMEAELERYRRIDAIEECTSEWASALVPVRKANGKLRVCLDSRRINAWTKKDSYPMRNMGGIFHRLGKATYYSVVDLKDATPQGLFRFKVCPFGLTNAPFTMCRLMDRVIGFDLEPNVFVYLDDIVIATKTFSEHVRLLRIVADRLTKANLTISLDKSHFCRKQVTYLGYLLTEDEVSIDNSRISPILDYARPRNVKDIRRLLGLAGFYQRFIRDYSRIVAPISDLLKKAKNSFRWTDATENAFEELRTALISAPILGNPDFNLPFTIESDASDNAVGAALLQQQNDQQKVIAYFSKKLSSTQRKYASVEKECLGVLLAIEHFRHYVEGTRFKVVTDARSLLWLFIIGVESGNAKLLRWALKIQSYDIELEYKKGKNNILADCLSRSVETISLQQADLEYRNLATRIYKEPTKFPDFRVIDERIWKLVKQDSKIEDARFQWKSYPPMAEREELVRDVHERAHLGAEKTLAALRERYYWPRMSSEVKRFCRRCLTCQTSKATNQNTTAPMNEQKKIVQYPWQFLAMDYVGPLPASGKGRSTCLLVITDLFSKFVIVQPFRQATADSLVHFVENSLFLLFGVPEVILSDNGTQFVSASFRNLLTRYHVTHWRTPNYHPQINDTERVNRVITTAIRACIRKDHREWANNLQQIASAVRNSVHDATRYTPYFVLFGRNMVSDGREYRHLRDASSTHDGQLKDDERDKLLADVRKNLKSAYEKHSSYYNLRSNSNCATYSVGERVLKKNTEQSDKEKGFCAKLAPKYVLAVIKRIVGSHCYDLEDLKGKRLGIFNCAYLKKLNSQSSSPS